MFKKLKNFPYWNDVILSPIVMIIAGCGLVYQYLLASYAGRIIGVMEKSIFLIMSIMILFMGIGSFFAKRYKDKFYSFSILESCVGFTALATIFIISGANAFSNILPEILANTFNIPLEFSMHYGFISTIQDFLNSFSYIMAAFLGFMLGMEIPFIAAIREKLYKGTVLENNIGVIYGVDYLGAAIGAGLWIYYLMGLDVSQSLQYVTTTNVIVGFVFLLCYSKHMTKQKLRKALLFQVVTSVIIIYACHHLDKWQNILESTLYKDKIVYSANTPFQHFVVTSSINPSTKVQRNSLFINGKTQFSDSDEGIYHAFLVYPPLIAAGLPKDVLVIGGGDGLAVRDILRTNPDSVTLLDLDPTLVNFFTNEVIDNEGNVVNYDFIALNDGAFKDNRVHTMFGDAYLNVKELIAKGKKFGAIIVDLPDPSHPDLNKLYSKEFYTLLNQLLVNDGAISIQSTSPYSAKAAFISIGKTLSAANFHVQQYQRNIPSFSGQWGWTIGTKSLPMAKARIANYEDLPIDDEWLTKGLLLGGFEFGKNYYHNIDNIKVNTIDNNATYNYYLKAWEDLDKSVFQ